MSNREAPTLRMSTKGIMSTLSDDAFGWPMVYFYNALGHSVMDVCVYRTGLALVSSQKLFLIS